MKLEKLGQFFFSSFISALAKIINKLLWLVLPGNIILYLQNSTGTLGSSSKDDRDGNEDGKKAMGLDWQKKNFARASRFFIHFFAVVA